MGRVNKKRVDLRRFDKLMKDLDRKISIKVGILSPEGSQKHPDSDLTMAELGAIHEFGATINVTDKMRGWFYHNYGIRKSNKPIQIPARSFLRMPLMEGEGRKQILKAIRENIPPYFDQLSKESKVSILDETAHIIAEKATYQVLKAFETGGYGQWEPISEFTAQNRKYNPSAPPLTDEGSLKRSIKYDIKEG